MNGHRLLGITNEAEDQQEAIRLLYVATTRAADFLVLSSGVNDTEKAGGVWMQLLAERFDLSSGRLAASLPDDYPEPRVAVVTEPPEVNVHRGIANPRVNVEKTLREIEAAAITPVLDRVLPLAQAVAALEYAASGRARGKIVLTMSPAATKPTTNQSAE